MEPVTWLFVVGAAAVVFVIAAVVVGREARRLDAVAPRAVYEIDIAADFVAEQLPTATQGRLTMDELDALLRAHLRWLHAKGLQPPDVIDHRQDIITPVVIAEDTLSAYLLGEADRLGVELLDDVDVIHVVEGHLAYFEAIGAVGPQASDPDV
jgi:hypothetical protein